MMDIVVKCIDLYIYVCIYVYIYIGLGSTVAGKEENESHGNRLLL